MVNIRLSKFISTVKRISILIIISILFCPLAIAQSQLKGTVFDDNKEPLVGAVVQLKGQSNHFNVKAGLMDHFHIPILFLEIIV